MQLAKETSTGHAGSESFKEFARELNQNIANLAEQLEKKRYRAKLVRRADIPKGEGKTRPLGIPAIADKIVPKCCCKNTGNHL